MTALRYMSIVSIAYLSAFFTIFLILNSYPPYPVYEAGPMAVAGAIIFGWLGTVRIQQIVGVDRTEFNAASVFHALLIAIMIGGAIYIRVGPGL